MEREGNGGSACGCARELAGLVSPRRALATPCLSIDRQGVAFAILPFFYRTKNSMNDFELQSDHAIFCTVKGFFEKKEILL